MGWGGEQQHTLRLNGAFSRGYVYCFMLYSRQLSELPQRVGTYSEDGPGGTLAQCHLPANAICRKVKIMYDTTRATAISIKPKKWDKAYNADKMEAFFREAARDRPDLIVTTEGVLEGYVVTDVIEQRKRA